MTLYQSYKQQITVFAAKKKAQQSYEEKQSLKWKICIMFLAVGVIVLLGVLSEVMKAISRNETKPYDSTFMYPLIRQSSLLTDFESLNYFIKGFNTSTDIIYDHVEKIYEGNTVNLSNLIANITDKSALLYLWEVEFTNETTSTFAMFLKKNLSPITDEKQVLVTDDRDDKASTLWSLQASSSIRINIADNCFLYAYRNQNDKSLSLLQLIGISQDDSSSLSFQIFKSQCFGNSVEEAQSTVASILGYEISTQQPKSARLMNLEVFRLSMEYQSII